MQPSVDPNNAGSIKAAYSGYAGWNDNASIVADFKATGGQGKGGPSAGGPGGAPSIDLVGITNAAYNTPEITAANQALTDTGTKITARQQALSDAQAEINDNPFYAEATRVGQSAKLTAQANSDIGVLQNSYNEAQNNLTNLKADAAIKVNAALGQYNIDSQAYQSKLQQFDAMLQAGGLTGLSSGDLAMLSTQVGIPASELQGIQTYQANNAIKTALVTANDGTISVINSGTGQIISQTKPGVGATVTAGGGSGGGAGTKAQQQQDVIAVAYSDLSRLADPRTGFVSKEDWKKVKDKAIQYGLDPSTFNQQLAGFTDPNGKNSKYYYN